MAQVGRVVERGVVRCLARDCDFLDVDVSGPGIDSAKRHADQAEHPVEVRIEAFLVVDPEPPELDDDEEDEEDDEDEEDGVEWVGTGTCENCSREDVDLCVWARMSICVDCLVLAQSGQLI